MADNPRIEELRRRVQTDPASIAFAQLAEEYRRAGHFEDAAQVCRAGLERHPSYLSARVTLGRALIELERYDEAHTELEYVLRSAPENLAAIRGLAEIHQRRGNLGEALRQYQTALSIARHDPELEESVHDLSRQLGEPQSEPPPSPEPPPQIAIELPDAAFGAASEPASLPATPESPSTLPSLSPELEAAADEFTKALLALDSLALDLPAALDDRPPATASPAPAFTEPDLSMPGPEVVGAQEPLPAADLSMKPPEAAAAGEPHDDAGAVADAAVANELDAWLAAIVLDRAQRATAAQGHSGDRTAGRVLPDLPDLPLNSQS